MKKKTIILLALMMLALNACALRNPAAVYCDSLGYNYTVERTEDGDVGYCRMPNERIVEAWSFLQGKAARNYTYCARQGLTLKVTNDTTKCGRLMTSTCAVCVKDGEEVEVTRLMGLTFAETTCGDDRCSFPENYQTCPQDCPSGGKDSYCDAQSDGRCDPDCKPISDQKCDIDCPPASDPECMPAQAKGEDAPKSGSCIPLLTFPLAFLVSAAALGFKP